MEGEDQCLSRMIREDKRMKETQDKPNMEINKRNASSHARSFAENWTAMCLHFCIAPI